MRRPDLSAWAPPGYPLRREYHSFLALGGAAVCFGLLYFLSRYTSALNALYLRDSQGRRVLQAGAVLPDFAALFRGSLTIVFLLLLCVPVQILAYYLYHYKGSRSIYLMRRLPQRWELLRRCVSLPLLMGLGYALLGAALLLVCFSIYHAAAPAGCVAPGQWQILWRYGL